MEDFRDMVKELCVKMGYAQQQEEVTELVVFAASAGVMVVRVKMGTDARPSIVLKISHKREIIEGEAHCNNLVYSTFPESESGFRNVLAEHTALAAMKRDGAGMNDYSTYGGSSVVHTCIPTVFHKMYYICTRFEGYDMTKYKDKITTPTSINAVVSALCDLYTNFILPLNNGPEKYAHNDLKPAKIILTGYDAETGGFLPGCQALAIGFGHLVEHSDTDTVAGTFHGLGTCFSITLNGQRRHLLDNGELYEAGRLVINWNGIQELIIRRLKSIWWRITRPTQPALPARHVNEQVVLTIEDGKYNTDKEFLFCLKVLGYPDDDVYTMIKYLIINSKYQYYGFLGNFVVLDAKFSDAYATVATIGHTMMNCNANGLGEPTKDKLRAVVDSMKHGYVYNPPAARYLQNPSIPTPQSTPDATGNRATSASTRGTDGRSTVKYPVSVPAIERDLWARYNAAKHWIQYVWRMKPKAPMTYGHSSGGTNEATTEEEEVTNPTTSGYIGLGVRTPTKEDRVRRSETAGEASETAGEAIETAGEAIETAGEAIETAGGASETNASAMAIATGVMITVVASLLAQCV